jgi:hypothetical protein
MSDIQELFRLMTRDAIERGWTGGPAACSTAESPEIVTDVRPRTPGATHWLPRLPPNRTAGESIPQSFCAPRSPPRPAMHSCHVPVEPLRQTPGASFHHDRLARAACAGSLKCIGMACGDCKRPGR